MQSQLRKEVGVVGLGAMGGAMASALVKQGWSVTGFDPSEKARSVSAKNGVTTSDALTDLAGKEFILLSLPSANIVEKTVSTLVLTAGTVAIVDATTSEPQVSRRMADLANSHAIAFVDSPVSGGRDGAESGSLSAFVGGAISDVTAAEPLLEAITGGKRRHVGPPGAGNIVKLMNNMLCSVNLLAVAEAADVAAAYDVDPAVAIDAINSATGASIVSQDKFPNQILNGRFDSGFSLKLMARDVKLAHEAAVEAGGNPRTMALVDELWQSALEQLGPEADFEAATTTFTSITETLHRGEFAK
jgi:3-hydroxyisobutyrate dehydrogenase